jgi:hypothetical protein
MPRWRPPFRGRHPSRGDQRYAGRDDERAPRSGERQADRFDRAALDRRVVRKAREIVIEGGVDDRIRIGGAGAQALEIFEAAAAHRDPGGRESRSGGIRARQSRDGVPGGAQLLDDGRSNPSCGSGNKYVQNAILR